jgi:hypothetical protein
MEEDDEDEERPDGEEDGGRIARDAEPAGDRVQPAAPGRENEQNSSRQKPQQCIALLQTAAADELEDDEQEQDGRDGRED